MGGPRVYRMTISSFMSNEDRRELNEYEIHYKARRRGRIKAVRRYLLKRSVKHFQRAIYRLTKKWIPLKRIRISFERETPTQREEEKIETEARRMIRRLMRWEAEPFTTRTLTYHATKTPLKKPLVNHLKRFFKKK